MRVSKTLGESEGARTNPVAVGDNDVDYHDGARKLRRRLLMRALDGRCCCNGCKLTVAKLWNEDKDDGAKESWSAMTTVELGS